jgi:polar amino acid transport system permease protein
LRVVAVWVTLFVLFVLFFMSFGLKFSFIAERFPALAGLRLTKDGFIQGAALTLFVCFFSIIASSVLGLISALGRLSSSAVCYGVSTFYTSFFRGTPLLVQIFLIYLGLPQLGPVPDAIPAGIIALSLNYGAYLSEIFRSGIMSVPVGQREAGMSLGLPKWVVFWTITLPQATRIVIPPTGSQFIAMLKDSSLISVMGVWEIMFLAQSFGRSSYRYIEMLTTAATIYWILSICFEIIQSRLELKFGKGYSKAR